MTRPAAVLSFLAVLATPIAAQTPDEVRQAGRLASQASERAAAGEWKGSLALLRRALALRPGHPGLLYAAARAQAGMGGADSAAAVLERLAAWGLAYDRAGDSIFARAAGDPRLAAAAARLRENGAPGGTAEVAFTLPDPLLLPEGIAYDPRSRTFFIGSVHRRMVVAVPPGQSPEVTGIFAEAGTSGLWAAQGMRVDTARRALWLATSALPEAAGIHEVQRGQAALVRFDLASGRMTAAHLLPRAAGPAVAGDVALGPEGDVFVSDAAAGAVYVLRRGGRALEPLAAPGTFVSPQGMALVGGRLYAADYARGIFTVDPRTGRTSPVAGPGTTHLLGIDGLAAHGGSLVAVQNGPPPHRVVRLDLSADGDSVRSAEVLLRAHPAFDEPTLGTVVDGWFYLVANSQWGRFQDGREPAPSEVARPVILRVRVDGTDANGLPR